MLAQRGGPRTPDTFRNRVLYPAIVEAFVLKEMTADELGEAMADLLDRQAVFTRREGAILGEAMSRKNVELVRAAEAAFNAGDDDAVASLAHPDIEWETGLLGTPTYRGREGVLALLRDVRKSWADMAMQIVDDPLVVRDVVIAEARLSAYGRTAGVPVTGTQYLVVEFRDALAWRVRVFMTGEDAVEATGLRE